MVAFVRTPGSAGFGGSAARAGDEAPMGSVGSGGVGSGGAVVAGCVRSDAFLFQRKRENEAADGKLYAIGYRTRAGHGSRYRQILHHGAGSSAKGDAGGVRFVW